MIVVAIIGILAAIAIPAYQNYIIRTQVSEGLNLAGPAKNAIVEYVLSSGSYPSDNSTAGIAAAANYKGKYVASISVKDAVISIRYGNDANAKINGETVTLTAVDNAGSFSWICGSPGTIANSMTFFVQC